MWPLKQDAYLWDLRQPWDMLGALLPKTKIAYLRNPTWGGPGILPHHLREGKMLPAILMDKAVRPKKEHQKISIH